MFYALSWVLVLSLLALWSAGVWLLHAAAAWTASSAGALTGLGAGMQGRLPDWLQPWVPPDLAQALGALVTDLAPLVDGLLQAAPALSGVLSVAAWVVWGLGAALLMVLGAGLHVAIAVWRSRSRAPQAVPARILSAG